jgi:hypothetical protein
MLFTMRKAAILISALAFGAVGLFAQDELATYQASMRAAAAAANGAMRDALTANDTATGSAKAKAMSRLTRSPLSGRQRAKTMP